MPDDAALRFRQVFFGPARAERAAAAEPGGGFGGAAPPRAVSGSGGRESPTPQEAKHELERRQRRQRLRFQDPGVDATVRAEQLERRRQFVPSVDMGALHWHRRPDPPPPPPELTRSVRAADLVAWAQASAARAAHARARADWGASFRGYVVGAELLRMVLDDDQPRPQLRADAREKMDALLSAAETLRRAHPFQCLAEAAATPAPPLGGGSGGPGQVRQAKAWAGLDEAADEAAARHAAEENLLGNAELKAGNAAAAAEHFSRAIELAGHSSSPPPYVYYGNRSVAFLRMGDLRAALDDARAAVDLDPVRPMSRGVGLGSAGAWLAGWCGVGACVRARSCRVRRVLVISLCGVVALTGGGGTQSRGSAAAWSGRGGGGLVRRRRGWWCGPGVPSKCVGTAVRGDAEALRPSRGPGGGAATQPCVPTHPPQLRRPGRSPQPTHWRWCPAAGSQLLLKKALGAMWCAACVGRVCAGTLDTASLRLLESSELGDSEGVLRAIGEGGNLDAGHPGWLDYTPLHMAALHGHLEVARLLITAGATVASLACDGATPLHLAGSGAVAVSRPTCLHAHA